MFIQIVFKLPPPLFLGIIDIIIPDALVIAWLSRKYGVELPSWLGFLQSDMFITAVIVFTVTAIVIAFITHEKDESRKKGIE